jgi:hypothetical protein
MASHVSVTSITDLEIDDITVRKSGTEVTGRGFLDVDMQFGSAGDVEKDMGVLWDDSFPMTFKLLLNSDGEILRIEELDIDISSYTG